jgi:spermidine synthase
MALSEALERQVDEAGAVLELFRRGEAYDVIVDGKQVMASDARGIERSLVELAMAPLKGRDDITVLLAGLGMGYALRAILDSPGVTRVDVVESSRAIIEWEARYFAALNGDAVKDARVKLHPLELSVFLKQARHGLIAEPPADGWFAVILDIDDGPAALSKPGNAAFYTDDGIERLESALRPGGVLALWSSQRETELVRRLHARLQNVAEVAVPVELAGRSLDYVYRGRRHPHAPAATAPTSKPAN